MTAIASSERIPVTLLTGFLGSGKTTALNQLVQQAELADALVLINEFGDIGLDHLLVSHMTPDAVLEMHSGCVCCTVRSDLVKTLRDIVWRFSRQGKRQFSRVLIETTGLADPAPLIQTLTAHAQVNTLYRLDGVVTTVDLRHGAATLQQHEEAAKQVAMADLLLLTKADLSSAAQRAALHHALDRLNPVSPRLEIAHGTLPAAELMGLATRLDDTQRGSRWLHDKAHRDWQAPLRARTVAASGTQSAVTARFCILPGREALDESAVSRPACFENPLDDPEHAGRPFADAIRHLTDASAHDRRIESFSYVFERPIAQHRFSAWRDALSAIAGSSLLRLKGIVNLEGHATPLAVHGVQHTLHAPVPLAAWPSEDRRSRLVFITYGPGCDAIEASFEHLGDAWQAEQEVLQ